MNARTNVVIFACAFVGIFMGAAYVEDEYEAFPLVFPLAGLDGKNGFTMNGGSSLDHSGYSISGAGDINGDGIDDILISAQYSGPSYVVFGSKGPWAEIINLNELNGTNGFAIKGVEATSSVSRAGDVNGDGIDDIVLGAPFFNNSTGQSYVVFGREKSQQWPAVVNLPDLNGVSGFALNGIHPDDFSGYSVSEAGDVNGDGIDDIIIGASRANNYVGQSYVVYGSKKRWDAEIDLFTLDGTNGFILNGISGKSFGDISVSGAGDVNDDGIDDIIIGAPLVVDNAGQSYVVFGRKEPRPAVINLADLTGANGFAVNGAKEGDYSGKSVHGLGDVNDDGIDDVVIGARSANNRIGQSYVVFGREKSQQWPATINLADLNGGNGFTINGRAVSDSGYAVSGAGDVNDDGISDIIIGAPYTGNSVGQSYIVFGSEEPWDAVINLSNLNGTNGFFINGIHPSDSSGCSVSGAGDVNGDGVDDILIGAYRANKNAGQGYVIFGEKRRR